MSLAEFAQGDFDAASRAALISSVLQSLGRPVLEDIMGAGLSYAYDRLRPMVLIFRGSEPESRIRFLYETPAFDLLQNAFGGDPGWLNETVALTMPHPEPFATVGDLITSPNPGRVGCQVHWSGGTGFLTAGHVAPTVGGVVFDRSTRLGTVRFANNPARGGTAPMADVSVVETTTAIASSFGRRVAAAPNSDVTVQNGRGGSSGRVFAFCSFAYWAKVTGTYGDVYITDRPVSVGGDSGSAVTNPNKNVVGILVGGSASNSFVQDLQYQINQASLASSSGLSGLSV